MYALEMPSSSSISYFPSKENKLYKLNDKEENSSIHPYKKIRYLTEEEI
jgi:hypothetical protein